MTLFYCLFFGKLIEHNILLAKKIQYKTLSFKKVIKGRFGLQNITFLLPIFVSETFFFRSVEKYIILSRTYIQLCAWKQFVLDEVKVTNWSGLTHCTEGLLNYD